MRILLVLTIFCYVESIFGQKVFDIDNYIAFDKTKVVAEAHATQFLSHGVKTQKAILIMHGLHESPYYMKSISLKFFEKGYNVLSLRLPGHMEKNIDAMTYVKYENWIESAQSAFEFISTQGQQIEILGYSTGGTLAMYLGLAYPQRINKLYFIAPALQLSLRLKFATHLLGWTKTNTKNLCTAADNSNFVCQILMLDQQLKSMIEEGIVSYPWAGYQVDQLIHSIYRQYTPLDQQFDELVLDERQSDKVFSVQLEKIYRSLQVPFVMVNSIRDVVVDHRFNRRLCQNNLTCLKYIEFEKKNEISHIMMNKSFDDRFQKSSQKVYNPKFDAMMEQLTEP